MPDETKPKALWPIIWKSGAVLFLSFLALIGRMACGFFGRVENSLAHFRRD